MRLIIVLLLWMAFIAPTAAAGGDNLQQIKEDLRHLMARVEALEAENQALRQATETVHPQPPRKPAPDAAADLKLSGDLRIRYESIDVGASSRERSRVRARIGLSASPTENVKVGLGLASGSDDPISSNQSLGSGASTKDMSLDLAYFTWRAKNLAVTGGKAKNPYYSPGSSGLLWDGDYRPEGLSASYTAGNAFVTGGIHFLESDTRRSNHRIAYGVQAGYDLNLSAATLTAGIGYFDIGTAGRSVFYGNVDDFFGNTFTCSVADPDDCRYDNDYRELELFAALSSELGGQPVSAYVDYVQNQGVDNLDTGWTIGARLGKASSPGTWEFVYAYQELEADAVFGLWADSDFAGGGTDGKGHVIRGGWAIDKRWSLKLTYFDTVRGMDLGAKADYRRLQLDTSFRF